MLDLSEKHERSKLSANADQIHSVKLPQMTQKFSPFSSNTCSSNNAGTKWETNENNMATFRHM